MKVAYKKKLNSFALDVDFEIPDTGITVLFGPSGAGKSSILNLLSGLDNEKSKVLSAYFELNKKIYDDSENKINIKTWKRNIGYVFQDNRLFPHMTIQQNISFGHKRRSSDLDISQVVEKFSIRKLLEQYPQQLSGGEKHRVAMVRAVLSNPDLLILDEPMAALDYQSRQDLLPYIECIHKELTIPVIFVSHDIKEVLRLANYVVVIDKGKVIDKGDIADLCISQPLMTQAEGASFILEGEVSKIYEKESLVEISLGREKILLVDQNLKLQQNVRVLIHAREVSLCLSAPVDSSILNCVPVIVKEITPDVKGKLRVIATIDEQVLVAMISQRSADQLKLEVGSRVFAQFKATGMIK